MIWSEFKNLFNIFNAFGLFRISFDRNLEFGSERIPRSLLRGKRANAERYCSLRIEDSPQLAAESFNYRPPAPEAYLH
jgi:hypothetical protein